MTAVPLPIPEPLRLLTFEDLIELAEAKRSRATSEASRSGWDRLLEVARALGGRATAGDLVSGRTWTLLRVSIDGYQGVGAPLTIDLDPTPGVTVLIGRNGSGKSSIADAIETALHGEPRAPASNGKGGKAPLWERQHCGRDATQAHVEVTLLAGEETLTLGVRIAPDGSVTGRTARHAAADGTTTDVDLDTTSWRSALAGHRPVFGYAAVERQVQLAQNLQEFLEPLLAFGGCFDELKTGVDSAGSAAARAQDRWTKARDDARHRTDQVDHERADPAPTQIDWPDVTDDPNAWLTAAGLTETGAAAPEITSDHHDRLHAAATKAFAALRDLESAEATPAPDLVTAKLAAPLAELHRAVEHLDTPGDICPVCRREGPDWATNLAATVDTAPTTETQTTEFARRLGALRAALDNDLVPIKEVVAYDWCTDALRDAARPVLAAGADLRHQLDEDGRRATPEVRAAVRAAHSRLTSTGWHATVTELAAHTDRERQWQRARRSAVEPFLSVWREVRDDAAAAASWKSASDCVRTLQNDLRADRTRNLQALTDSSVRTLLDDVGLHITGLSVKGTKADVQVVDVTGQAVGLSLLSAGQRNALLLAPLLAVAHGGPFGFLVLDDPVHAFDQIRVDRLAQLIDALAADRRVIVLTHDERLREHLLVHSPHHTARKVHRDHLTGVVEETPSPPMWEVLLKDADAALAKAPKPGPTTTPPTVLIRSLCRMAFDDALRHFVLQESVGVPRDPQSDLAFLDETATTKKRISAALTLHPGHPRVLASQSIIAPHLDGWNQAAHGRAKSPEPTTAEISDARSACQTLLGLP
ncbi:RecF/RecN/SMC family protein [Pseudonocardia sediminis]|uniref:Nuclease SbcCD subunit C n=1 Tax=Pseudonocardia sediminis TaxID=1397368 RepID=A0A4V2FQJ2_PSEST|nr:ATP-binding protein [Pseudonocardia sediminis]RZT84910.1 RecF/RecN/SMC family protein [Pseudonocardia sediminis]